MSEKLMVKCRKCGAANSLKMGRIYTVFHCSQCEAEIDLDATLTFELEADRRPVKLIRDTVTVGFRSREADDQLKCGSCGATADVELEEVLGHERTYRCPHCGNLFGNDVRAQSTATEEPQSPPDE
jgi:DNA-directed RNA polymerase subunit RPC12/RpoP